MALMEELVVADKKSTSDSQDSNIEKSAFETPTLEFSNEEVRALVKKLDWHIVPAVTVLYLANFIDRTNIGQFFLVGTSYLTPGRNSGNAKVAGLEKDLGLVGYQYNIGLSIFYVVYALTELPSNLLLKKFGARIWIPSLVLVFGFVCFTTAFVTNFGGFMTIRVFLGLAEGGMMPGVTYYLSTYYTRNELALRVGIFVSAASLSGAFGGLLASALLSIPQIEHLPHGQWRSIFLIEGLVTMALAVAGYFVLPKEPQETSFLTDREKLIAVERIRTEYVGLSKVEATDRKLVIRAWTNINNWICAVGFLLCNISVQGISLFMPTLLAGMGYSTIQSQLRTVPPYVVASIWSIFISWASARTGKRGLFVLISTPIAIVGSSLLVGTADRNAGYAGLFLLSMGVFPLGPLFLTWGSNNSSPYTTRATSSAIIVGIGSLGPIISAWTYLPTDQPRYIIGNAIQLGAQGLILIVTTFLVLWNLRENRLRKLGKRDYRLNADEETISKLGHLHPRYRLTI